MLAEGLDAIDLTLTEADTIQDWHEADKTQRPWVYLERTSRRAMTEILVSEVGPRDGLQSIDRVMPLEAKKRWIAAEAEAGVKEIEVGSFVPPKALATNGRHRGAGRFC